MTTILGAMCGCGRSISIPCPTVADIPAASAQMTGWGHDERGHVRCPDCLGLPTTTVYPPPSGQLPLFGGEAA